MKVKVITGIVAIFVLAAVLYFRGLVLYILGGLLAIQAYRELSKLSCFKNVPKTLKIFGLLLTLFLTFMTFDGYSIAFGISYQAIAVTALILLLPAIFLKDKYPSDVAFKHFGIVTFLGLAFNGMILIINYNVWMFLYLISITIITDTFAMFGGMLVGKHKLIPHVSPNKTIEGSIIGSVLATIISSIIYYNMVGHLSIVYVVLITLFFSLIGQLGDLMFSLIKRENGIKDFSKIIPGHGGVLDRVDSIIFVIIAFLLFFNIL